jgi:hypothetical protein
VDGALATQFAFPLLQNPFELVRDATGCSHVGKYVAGSPE